MTLNGECWPELRRLGAYRITEIPRRDSAMAVDAGRPQRAAALAAAYHAAVYPGAAAPEPGTPEGPAAAPGTIAFGWIRLAAAGPVHVIVAGNALPGSTLPGSSRRPGNKTGRDDVLLSLPAGARGTALPSGGLGGLLDGIGYWHEVAVVSDGLLVPDGGSGQDAASPGMTFEEGLLGSWADPFGWIVIATPLPAPGLRTLADGVARRLHLAESAADRFPERAVEVRRLAARHAELRRGASAGFWRIRVAAGGPDPASAAQVAGLVCGSAGLDGLPYALTPATPVAAGDDGALTCGSTELLAALVRPPETEVPGVRLTLRPEFDVTPDMPETRGAAVRLGDILDRNLMPAGPLRIPLQSLNRHVFVCGATGAGKSHTVRSMLEAATAHGIPWLVVEPAKAEYRLMANRLASGGTDAADVIRIRPGEADAIAAGLNPLEPAAAGDRAFPLQTHADLVRALFIASFRSEEPFPQVLSAALTRAYEEAGWDLALGEPRRPAARYPALGDLQRAAERVVTEIGYSQRVTDDVLGFIRVRIASLRAGTTGRFLEGGHPIDFGKLLTRNAVLEIEDVGDDRDKAFLMGTVLIRLAEHLRLTRLVFPQPASPDRPPGQPQDLRHLTVIEEAHRLLRRAEPGTEHGAGAHAVEMFAGLLAEIRAYGEGLIIAEQIPARVISDVVKNTAVKITHRLPAADDRDAVGATMNMTPAQSRYLVTLPPGQAAAFADGMDYPVLVKIRDSTEREFAALPLTADCAGVVTPRSVSCGPDCAARPCTLREMRGAQRVLAEHPWLPLWAELTVAAHLAGWPMPAPTPAVLAELKAVPDRLARCAASHAVDTAIAARRPAGSDGDGPAGAVDTGGLAAHAADAISARVSRDAWLCPAEEPRWRLPGPVTAAVVLGTVRPSVIESAGAPRELLANFVDCQWLFRYLPGAPRPAA